METILGGRPLLGSNHVLEFYINTITISQLRDYQVLDQIRHGRLELIGLSSLVMRQSEFFYLRNRTVALKLNTTVYTCGGNNFDVPVHSVGFLHCGTNVKKLEGPLDTGEAE
jgi:hypothetical protein